MSFLVDGPIIRRCPGKLFSKVVVHLFALPPFCLRLFSFSNRSRA